jgi:hypothetical protein
MLSQLVVSVEDLLSPGEEAIATSQRPLAIREIKAFVDAVSLLPAEEFPPQMNAFFASVARRPRTAPVSCSTLGCSSAARRNDISAVMWSGSSPPSREKRQEVWKKGRSSISGGKIGNTLGCQAEPAIAAGGAGITAFRIVKSLQPAPLLNLVLRLRVTRTVPCCSATALTPATDLRSA